MNPWLLVIFFAWNAFAQQAPHFRKLHITTWPTSAEVFADQQAKPGYQPAPLTPSTLLVHPDSGWVRLHFFKHGYADTILDVRVPSRPESYLMVQLRTSTDPVVLQNQESFLATRTRHNWGRRLLFSSVIPVLVSGAYALHAQMNYDQAKENASLCQNSVLTQGDNFRQAQNKYYQSVDTGDRSLQKAKWSLGIGAALLFTGFILTF